MCCVFIIKHYAYLFWKVLHEAYYLLLTFPCQPKWVCLQFKSLYPVEKSIKALLHTAYTVLPPHVVRLTIIALFFSFCTEWSNSVYLSSDVNQPQIKACRETVDAAHLRSAIWYSGNATQIFISRLQGLISVFVVCCEGKPPQDGVTNLQIPPANSERESVPCSVELS